MWSVHVVESTPLVRTPGPTKPTHVLPISSWMSPWFHAKPGTTQVWIGFAAVPHGADVVKKKSGFANIVNVGVRVGSVFTMCSAFSSTGSASAVVSGTV